MKGDLSPLRHPAVLISLILLMVYAMLAIAVVMGWLDDDWWSISGGTWEGISTAHWFGTNQVGQDIFARAVVSTQTSFSVGLSVSLGALFAGVVLGASAGLNPGGWLDEFVMWLAGVLDAVPFYLLAAVVAFAFKHSPHGVYFALIAAFWTTNARLVRGEVMRLNQSEFVAAARMAGLSTLAILMRHILPNAVAVMLIQSVIVFVAAVKAEVVLSFIGLGITDGISWGVMLAESTQEVLVGHLNNFLAASLMLSLLILALNIIADWLQDVLDPRYQTRHTRKAHA